MKDDDTLIQLYHDENEKNGSPFPPIKRERLQCSGAPTYVNPDERGNIYTGYTSSSVDEIRSKKVNDSFFSPPPIPPRPLDSVKEPPTEDPLPQVFAVNQEEVIHRAKTEGDSPEKGLSGDMIDPFISQLPVNSNRSSSSSSNQHEIVSPETRFEQRHYKSNEEVGQHSTGGHEKSKTASNKENRRRRNSDKHRPESYSAHEGYKNDKNAQGCSIPRENQGIKTTNCHLDEEWDHHQEKGNNSQEPDTEDRHNVLPSTQPQTHPADLQNQGGHSVAIILLLVVLGAIIAVISIGTVGFFLVVCIVAVVPCLSIKCRRRTLRAVKTFHRQYPVCGLKTDNLSLADAVRKYERGLLSPQVCFFLIFFVRYHSLTSNIPETKPFVLFY